MKGGDGLVHSVNIQTKNGATNQPVSKLHPLELSEDVSNATHYMGGKEDCATAISLDILTIVLPRQWLAEWTEIIRTPPKDVGDC